MRSLALASFILPVVTVLSACDQAFPCTDISVASVMGVVADANQGPVPISSIKVRQGSIESSCFVENGAAPITGNAYTCRDLRAGQAVIELVAAGQTRTREVELAWSEGSEGCHTETMRVDFTLDVGCPQPTGVAVRGTVLDRPGQPAVLREVGISVTNPSYPGLDDSEYSKCTVDGASYECAALTSYDTPYTVQFSDAAGDRFTQEVLVPAPACTVSTLQLDVERATFQCSRPLPPAVAGYVYEDGGNKRVSIDSARARLGEGEFVACLIEDESLRYVCAAQGSSSGAGLYTIEVQAGGKLYSSQVMQRDQGCAYATLNEFYFAH